MYICPFDCVSGYLSCFRLSVRLTVCLSENLCVGGYECVQLSVVCWCVSVSVVCVLICMGAYMSLLLCVSTLVCASAFLNCSDNYSSWLTFCLYLRDTSSDSLLRLVTIFCERRSALTRCLALFMTSLCGWSLTMTH